MRTTYELGQDWTKIFDWADDPDVDDDMLMDALEDLDEEIKQKLDGCTWLISGIEAQAAIYEAEEKRTKERKQALRNRAKRVKERMYQIMKLTGQDKIKTDLHSFSIQKNPKRLWISAEPGAVPQAYTVLIPEIDKDAIKAELDAGVDLPFAHYEQGESLRIR